MNEPRIIKEPLPGQAVERYRLRHNGFLPTEELRWIDSFITALQANLAGRSKEAEFGELKKLAIAGSYAIGQNADFSPRPEAERLTGKDADLLPGLREALKWKPNTPQLENAMTYAWESAIKSFIGAIERNATRSPLAQKEKS